MDVIIRPMRKEDVEEVLEIEKLSFSTPWSKEAFISEVTKNSCAKYIVAEVDNKIVGYGGFWVVVDEGHITNIAVHPEYRSKGIGSKIMEGLIDLAKKNGITAMTLEVRESNITAQHLYAKYGFRQLGRRKGYYQDNNEDAIIMWKYDL
ncbi:[SSU ribosomal protein S18P]-alanine acetyltransferase [Thermoanaerobacter thermohydrosulfuricus]|jgi:ribosomal-protein-alanine N-acetyltransferase|uniref:[Ribosomal protein bS18]-alanine N-acetyltransferase n=5 Tax=Thermoanaerobacter TaxID=1754 RepID=B0KBT5_THEP3|nr:MULTISPECIES: ribosomal protein S18-alanine N-acetyltransferase [Thermoanaerobacter]KUJ90144.1 MAG: ribosomal-protein-alanine acetyltransferase [Thermoanaerobacter thermocopriae]KUK34665.1 MAG: Ribosomal-protein-alanine acetyltransferase [Caldanaerobacter subterraneus]ABY91800.1 ribosomal-protein-alanine acetyltransferase [Thermoanaerobacter sp. X514]ABY95380.1 ribosomal-protein-alanine acetyltransferase [Thermoanaerobacter pseudethanolicus ATCC 33223]ADV80323.1 ribosomal-protein-alanine ac